MTASHDANIAETRAGHRKRVQNAQPNVADESSDSEEDITPTRQRPLESYVPSEDEISWTLEQFKLAQKDDPFCNEILQAFRDSKPVCQKYDLSEFLILKDLLYKRRSLKGRSDEVINVVIPTTLMEKAIRGIHFRFHTDALHTLFRFKLKYWHPLEKAMITKFVKNCEVCKILKAPPPRPIKIQSTPVATRPFQYVSFDFVGPLPVTDNNNKYILVIIDLFSRFCELHPTTDRSEETVIKCLDLTFSRLGYPEVCLSDNALEFCSNAVKKYAEIHCISKKVVIPFSPTGNSIIERNNKKINNLIRLYVNSSPQLEWDGFLHIVANSINNSYNESLGDTASYVVYMRDTCPNFQSEAVDNLYEFDSESASVKFRAIEHARIIDTIRANIINATTTRKAYRNLSRKDKNIEVGSRVLLRNFNRKSKLELAWTGPHVVKQLKRNCAFIEIRGKLTRCNTNHLLLLKKFERE
jgi:transposase InsO family protein